ncbi:hypothetical protein CDAR_265721 [Caerostris darwini]|uniref:Transposase n=1 Tax=Caerostris darwini TaxID=1538125 RepID=A0AAV4SZV1_9ARAC|nr:hypothetical protein CDAR_265721 [Caerostris darwini]
MSEEQWTAMFRGIHTAELIDNPACKNCWKQSHISLWRGCRKFPKLNIKRTMRFWKNGWLPQDLWFLSFLVLRQYKGKIFTRPLTPKPRPPPQSIEGHEADLGQVFPLH